MSRRVLMSLVVLSLLAVVLPASADEAADRRAALRQAEEPLRDRSWGAAVQALRTFRETNPGTPEAQEAWVLEARALLSSKAWREALDATSGFLRTYGESSWAGRVKSTAADAYAALSEPREAADALRERVEAATSRDARAKIAALHLKLADADYDGVETTDDLGRTQKVRNVARALSSYRHALAVGVAPAEVTRVKERIALSLEELGKPAEAAAVWNDLIEEGAKEGEQGEPTAAQSERWLVGRGRAWLRAGQRDKARVDLRGALERFPRGALAMETMLLLAEERLATAKERSDAVAFEEGVTWLRRAIGEHRGDERAAEAQKLLAEAYASHGQPAKAAAEWGAFVEQFPSSEFVAEARHRRALALVAAGQYDAAIATWERFLAAHPNHPLWQMVQGKIVETAFAKGAALQAQDDITGAIAAYRGFAERYPSDPRAPRALHAAALLVRQEGNIETAIALWREIAGRYANSAEAPLARLSIAQTEEDAGRLDDAVASYELVIEKHPGTPAAQQAAARLKRLKEKHLEVTMERIASTSEPPLLHTATRNIDHLDVRVYRLEIEEYFRRKGTVLGVDALQLEVVKPDLTATWTFEDYQPFALLGADRQLPVEGPGAYVVVVGDEDLTATVLFLVSDVEIVVKKVNARDLLVWAFDRTTRAPIEGARVLSAQGPGKIDEVGTTGADGVWHGRDGSRGSHVLVLSDRGPASTEIAPGPGVQDGFRDKAYVYTDRPLYRPGQEVRWRALYLRASGGQYDSPSKTKGKVVIRDARGQMLLEEDVTSSDFGTFAGDLRLGAAAPLGVYRIEVSVPRRGSWSGEFEVQEFRKPEFTIEVVPEQPVYLTGETVAARIRLRYAFGGVVADAPVRYEVYRVPRTFEPTTAESYAWYFKDDREEQRVAPQPDGTLVDRGETETGPEGDVVISFETTERDEDAEYIVRAAVMDVTRRWVVAAGRIPVTRRDHMAVVKTDRAVYRPQQEAEIEVRTVDALERPVSRSGTLFLMELKRSPLPTDVRRGGRMIALQEEEIERGAYPLTTAADGSARLKVSMPGPGRWRLRWRASDGRGAMVTAYRDVEASGEAEDPSKDARLTAAKPVYLEGDDAEILLHSPVMGKALLTYEGERVLAYRFVDIRGTSTLLSLPLEAEHAPNVFFKIAIPRREGLLEAETEVVVLRHLSVAVELPDTAEPGDDVEVKVTTTDEHGKPVAAEVGVSLVDETLYELASDRAGRIRPYFYDRRRHNGVVTASSLGFKAYGTTREANKDLLGDEEARTSEARRLLASRALQDARRALAQGDTQTAVLLALRAQEAAPDNYDAVAFLGELQSNESARKELARFRQAEPQAELMDRLSSLQGQSETGRPGAPAADARRPGDAEEDADEVSNGAIGLGGGAGGSFGGRAGRRNLEARGGGGGGFEGGDKNFVGHEINLSDGPVRGFLAKNAEGGDFGLGWGGGSLELRQNFADTAAWEPHLVTGPDGKATMKVTLPDNLTTWRAVVRGVSKGALVGDGRGRLVSRREMIVRIDPPRFLTQGDTVTVPVAIHNEAEASQDVQVTVKAEGVDGGAGEQTLSIGPGERSVLDRKMSARDPGRVRLEATARGPLSGDRTEVLFTSFPRGIRELEGRTGVVDTTRGALQETFFDLPEGTVAGATSLVVVTYPGIDEGLLDALLYLDLYPYGCIEQTVHRFLPALAARKALLAAGSPAASRLDRLDEAVRRGALRLRNLQNQDGSFGWFGGGGGNVAMTAYALMGLQGARASGVAGLDQAIANATAALDRIVGQAEENDRALAHLALATVGHQNAEVYATTFRRREDGLSVQGLAWMALAADRLGRSYDVEELTRLLIARRIESDGTTHWNGEPEHCFVGSAREATGWAATALIRTGRGESHGERALDWLLSNRVSGSFGSTKDTAAFVAAASAWVERHGAQAFGGTIEVLVDGAPVKSLDTRDGLDTNERRFPVPAAMDWAPGRHKLGFRLDGQGRVHWAARLEYVVASEDLPGAPHGLTVERDFVRPEEVAIEGQPAPVRPGYTVLRESARPRVEARTLERVVSGDRVLVQVKLNAPRDLEYVLVEDPLPAGFEVLEGTAGGSFDWQERRDDRQVFFLSKLPKGTTTLRYVLQANHWGAFTALGTTAYAMYLPEVHGRGPGHRIDVVPERSAGGGVEQLPTPDEFYGRARRLFEEGEYEEAAGILRALRDEQPLRDEIVEEIEATLLRGAIEQKNAQEIVRAREALVRRNPARIPDDWDTQRAIAFAYQQIGEFETASGLYRDLVARGFSLHVDWANTLTGRGREVEGLDELGHSLRSFPISNATAAAAFRRAQRYRELPRPEGRDRPAGEPMDEEALDALYRFTAHFAETTLAAPANYAVIQALRQGGALAAAASASEAFLRRFPKSPYVDDTWYFLAESRFKTFEPEPTAAGAKAVREAASPLVRDRFRRPDGTEHYSEYRPQAYYLLARVHHVLGELSEAVGLYYKARSIEDAREAYDFLTEERLDVASTIELPLTGPAEIPIGYRNLDMVELKAYPVDLQVLFAVRKSLEALHDVDLSGIVPAHEWTARFPDGKDHRRHEGVAVLPVEPGTAGAWLVVAKAGSHEAKTLVLKSDLSVTLQRVGEKIRVYVTDAEGASVRDAFVTISDGSRIRARGLTDGRGLFEAPGAGSGSAVVVSLGDRYAIAR